LPLALSIEVKTISLSVDRVFLICTGPRRERSERAVSAGRSCQLSQRFAIRWGSGGL